MWVISLQSDFMPLKEAAQMLSRLHCNDPSSGALSLSL